MRNWMKDGIGFMSMETFKKIFESGIPYAIKLNWRGEPLLHPNLCEMVKYAKQIGVHEVLLNTNGLLLDRDIAYDLAIAGLDWLIISADGATKETYEKIRRGGNFEVLFKNLMKLSLLYDRLPRSPKVRIQMCLQPDNEGEVVKWLDTFVEFTPYLRIGHLYNPQNQADWKIKQPKSCGQLWQRIVVDWQGNIHPCCSDFMGKYILGNIKDMTIREAWHNGWMEIWRYGLQHYGRKKTTLCQNCTSYC